MGGDDVAETGGNLSGGDKGDGGGGGGGGQGWAGKVKEGVKRRTPRLDQWWRVQRSVNNKIGTESSESLAYV